MYYSTVCLLFSAKNSRTRRYGWMFYAQGKAFCAQTSGTVRFTLRAWTSAAQSLDGRLWSLYLGFFVVVAFRRYTENLHFPNTMFSSTNIFLRFRHLPYTRETAKCLMEGLSHRNSNQIKTNLSQISSSP